MPPSSPLHSYIPYSIKTNDETNWRYMIVFASRAVADEWWRAVSTSGTNFSNSIHRITPQFYIHNPTLGAIGKTILAHGPAASFSNRVFFTLLPDWPDNIGRAMSVIPVQDITDHISGDLYVVVHASDSSFTNRLLTEDSIYDQQAILRHTGMLIWAPTSSRSAYTETFVPAFASPVKVVKRALS